MLPRHASSQVSFAIQFQHTTMNKNEKIREIWKRTRSRIRYLSFSGKYVPCWGKPKKEVTARIHNEWSGGKKLNLVREHLETQNTTKNKSLTNLRRQTASFTIAHHNYILNNLNSERTEENKKARQIWGDAVNEVRCCVGERWYWRCVESLCVRMMRATEQK